ncbi:hypothetical protein [Krasilnikovia sp. MM14-A1259]|uniref:hypothetical protein n=1 Tax=Krasilnikovia sp. MM14-A1259 TaxID=3373539 RepID=UPI003809FE7E
MTTTTRTVHGLVLYYLLRDEQDQHGDFLPEFSRQLAATVSDLHIADPYHYNRSGDLAAVAAPLHTLAQVATDVKNRTHTTDTIQHLTDAARDLDTAHPARECGWAEDCTVCHPLAWLGALIDAYQRMHTEPATTDGVTA